LGAENILRLACRHPRFQSFSGGENPEPHLTREREEKRRGMGGERGGGRNFRATFRLVWRLCWREQHNFTVNSSNSAVKSVFFSSFTALQQLHFERIFLEL
jgi:hypothetical protein